jgi:predicted MFS family arabinose efflux permease
MSAFPLASIAGVPLGIVLANRYEWHAPFFLIVVLALPTVFLAARLLPRRAADAATLAAHPFRQMRNLLAEPIHWRGFAVTAALVGASGCMIPFMAPSLVSNVGLSDSQLPWVYFFGGLATFASTPLLGWLTDRHDKLHVLAAITVPAAVSAFLLTRLGPSPLWVVLPLTALFFVGMSGRFGPASTLVLNAVEPRHRGGFTSLNSAVQSGGVAVANLIGGALITRDAAGRLVGYPLVGWFALVMFGVTLVLAHRLRAAAPHAATNTPFPLGPR